MNLFSRGYIFVFLFCIISCSTEEKNNLSDRADFNSAALKSLDGRIFSVNDMIHRNGISVIYFLMPGCPMCETYTLSINELDEEFSDKGISFCGVFSSDYYTDDEITSFRNDFKINIPFYRDVDFKLTQSLGATVTPEVYVLDSTATLLYSGSIDNWAYATGKLRMEATKFFLKDALENIVSGKPVEVASTEAFGCIIE